MSKSQKKHLARIILSLGLFVVALLIQKSGVLTGYQLLIVFLPVYLLIGTDILLAAFRGILSGQVFDENFLMSIATVGAFFIGEYPEAVVVMLFYQVGNWFEGYAVGKSRASISDLMNIRPDYANIQKDGQLIKVDPEEVKIDDEIIVIAGEKIPLDGIIVEGSSSVDTSALSGESVPRTLRAGDEVMSGCINLNAVLKIRVTKPFAEGTVAKILELVENASSKKAKVENFITKFARYYTPIVVILALLLAVIPPLVIPGATFSDWVYRALNFLVISCPCALVISVPLSFFGGIGGASKIGVLIKGSSYMEVLSESRTMVFDKTGTLTKGVFEVVEIAPASGIDEDYLLEVTAIAESFSNHPISISLKNKYNKEIDNTLVSDFEDIAGHGIKAKVNQKVVHAGNARLMDTIGAQYVEPAKAGTVVHVAEDNIYLGHIVISDTLKDDAIDTISNLKKQGIRTIMLTGDSNAVGRSVAKQLGMDEVYTELLPGDKVDKFEEILAQQEKIGGRVAFVGDGINDAPVLSRADIGISMGGLGSDAAIEASDVVIMDDKPSKIPTAMKIARKTLQIVHQNIVFAIGVKIIVLILSAFGKANMWQAVFADVGVSIIAIINAMRALKVKEDANDQRQIQIKKELPST